MNQTIDQIIKLSLDGLIMNEVKYNKFNIKDFNSFIKEVIYKCSNYIIYMSSFDVHKKIERYELLLVYDKSVDLMYELNLIRKYFGNNEHFSKIDNDILFTYKLIGGEMKFHTVYSEDKLPYTQEYYSIFFNVQKF